MALQFQDVFFPFAGGLDESIEPKIREQGFTVVENGWFDKDGRISKRPGLLQVASGSVAGSPRRVMSYGDQILAVDTRGRLYAVRNTDQTLVLADLIPEATVRRRGVRREIDENINAVDVAIAGQYTVYAWTTGTPSEDCYYRIVETSSGTIVASGRANVAQGSVSSVRVTTSGFNVLLTYYAAANTTLYARRIVCSSTPPSVGTETALVADMHASVFYDVCALTTGNWALTYKNSSGGNDRVAREVTNASPPALGWNAAITSQIVTHNACASVNGQLFTVWHLVGSPPPGATVYIVLDESTGAVVLGTTTISAGVTGAGAIGITPLASGVSSALVSWQHASGLMKWATASAGGTIGSIHQNFRAIPDSKPFYVASTDAVYQWIRTNGESGGLLVLVHLDRTVGGSGINMRPVSTAAFGVTSNQARQLLANMARETASAFRHAALVLVAPDAAVQGADEIRVNLDDRRSYQSVPYGRALYITGGILCQWDGVQAVENSFIQRPAIAAAGGAAGGLLPDGSYQLVAVYEEYDDKGEISRSLPSPVVTATVTGGGGNGRIDVTGLLPLTLTVRQDDAQQTPRVEIAIYVTEANQDVFYRTRAIGSAQANDYNATAAYTDTITTINPAAVTLYTTGGVLENDAVYGGATILCEHKGRLFAAGGEDPEVIWYSQPRVDGEPALFNLAQQIRVSGHDVTALASLDDALVVFTRRGIFLVHGEGPNALGDPSSGFFSDPIPLAADSGCRNVTGLSNENHCVAVCPAGIVFPTPQGIYLLDRGRGVRYLGGPVEDTFAAFPWVLAADTVPAYGHVRIIARNVAGTLARTLVWDYVNDKWAVWLYLFGIPLVDAHIYSGTYLVWSGQTFYVESSPLAPVYTDAGSWYGVSLTTGELTFGTGQALKRLPRVSLLLDRLGTGGVVIDVARDSYPFGTPGQSETKTWTTAAVAALQQDSVRAHIAPQKGRSWRFRIRETQPLTPDRGLAFVGLNLQVATIGGPERLAAADSR